jgi:hypothetical protein
MEDFTLGLSINSWEKIEIRESPFIRQVIPGYWQKIINQGMGENISTVRLGNGM